MANKLVYLQSLEGLCLKEVSLTEDAFTMTVGEYADFEQDTDSHIKIAHHHKQFCCENVSVDWSYVQDTSLKKIQSLIGKRLLRLTIKGVSDTGVLFRISYFEAGFEGSVESFAFLAPCYNEQNGYYSSELDLLVNGSVIPISSYVEDRIN
jgi:hypothetical protein